MLLLHKSVHLRSKQNYYQKEDIEMNAKREQFKWTNVQLKNVITVSTTILRVGSLSLFQGALIKEWYFFISKLISCHNLQIWSDFLYHI